MRRKLKIRRVTEYFLTNFRVKCGQTLSFVFDISSQSNLKLKRKLTDKVVKIRAKTVTLMISFVKLNELFRISDGDINVIFLKHSTFLAERDFAYYI